MIAPPEPRTALPPGGPQHRADEASAREVASPGVYAFLKRLNEFVLALCLLVVALPLMLLAMLLVKLTSRGPVLYSQTRLGRGGKPFTLYKIRSMTFQCEDLTGATWSKPGDSRVTWIGRWLRRTHLDELPQLWNILLGDMSLIGPRPERPEFVPQLEQAIPHYRERLRVRPGLTGLAQVQLPPDTDLTSVRRKLAYDLYYVQHCSWWLDIRICWATFAKMFGLPFRFLRACFGLPREEIVEQEYRRLGTGRTMLASSNGHVNGRPSGQGAGAVVSGQ